MSTIQKGRLGAVSEPGGFEEISVLVEEEDAEPKSPPACRTSCPNAILRPTSKITRCIHGSVHAYSTRQVRTYLPILDVPKTVSQNDQISHFLSSLGSGVFPAR